MKNIFARKKQPEDNFEAIENLEPDHPVYPVLKPSSWIGVANGALVRNFRHTEVPQLVIAFAYEKQDRLMFISEDNINAFESDKFIDKAYTNLDNYHSEFKLVESLENKVLTSSGINFCSEKILHHEHMIKAHEMLQAEELLVSVARRRCMLITNKMVDKPIMDKFIQLHLNIWYDNSFGNAPIGNFFFVLKNGEVQTIISPG